MMSYISIKGKMSSSLYVSIAGLKDSVVEYFTSFFPDASIRMCLDNDQWAVKFLNRVEKNLKLANNWWPYKPPIKKF